MIAVNEIFGPTIQGEGKSAGKEVIFLRLAGCNLACTWCDTPYTWNWTGSKFKHPEKFDPKKEIRKMNSIDIIREIQSLSKEVKRVVISGGEPILQQKNLIEVIELLRNDDYRIEVETNGTILPSEKFFAIADQINCSPKLENSGLDNPRHKRINPLVLMCLALWKKANFKFVISSDKDIPEILDILNGCFIKPETVYLMPEGRTKEEQEARSEQVRDLCLLYRFNFSPRLHVLKWGNKRGV